MQTSPVKLVVENLSKTFTSAGGETHSVLSEISLQIRKGEFVCIVGASGCGKTTFIRLLDGLTQPTSGRVVLDGDVITAPGPNRGFVFQQDSLLPWRTVLDNVLFGLEVQGRARSESEAVARDLINLVGLNGYERRYPHELSGGMRQRVNLARALAIDPEILLMDEPFAALDAQTREVMQRELLRVWERKRKTVIFITHQIDEAVFLADRVLAFGARPGRIKEDLHIPFARPRELGIKRTPEFLSLTQCIWDLIHADSVEH
jgi:NitT/TauT family transport system ATP-binding protein